MLPKKRRINKAFFGNREKNAKIFRSEHLIARVYDAGLDQSKFAVTVSKKIAKTAVSRNRLRRTAYRAIRNNLKKVTQGKLIHFIFNNNTEKMEEIESEISTIISKIK